MKQFLVKFVDGKKVWLTAERMVFHAVYMDFRDGSGDIVAAFPLSAIMGAWATDSEEAAPEMGEAHIPESAS